MESRIWPPRLVKRLGRRRRTGRGDWDAMTRSNSLAIAVGIYVVVVVAPRVEAAAPVDVGD